MQSTTAPLVSVIMSEYNTPTEKLDIAVQSILDQSFVNFEFIIIDDSGKNKLAEMAQKYKDPRISVVTNKKNKGLVYSLNRAITCARSDYLVRMDTDDESLPDRIETLYHFIKENPQYAVVGSRALEVADDKKVGALGTKGEKRVENIVSGDVPIHGSVIMNKKAVQNVGGYQEFTRAEDFALWCELVLHGFRLYVLEDILYKYNVNYADYSKRKLAKRKGEIQARWYYNKKLHAGKKGNIRMIKSILSGLAPVFFVQFYRKYFVLKNK